MITKAEIRRDIKRYYSKSEASLMASVTANWRKSRKYRREILRCYEYGLIFRNWGIGLNRQKDELLKEINNDVVISIVNASIGAYRTAIVALRSVFELTMQFIFYYDHPVEYSWWKRGDHKLTFNDSYQYLSRVASLKKVNKEIRIFDLLQNKYKRLSKFVHAETIGYMESQKADIILQFDYGSFRKWQSHYRDVINLCNVLLISYFHGNFKTFNVPTRTTILLNLDTGTARKINKSLGVNLS